VVRAISAKTSSTSWPIFSLPLFYLFRRIWGTPPGYGAGKAIQPRLRLKLLLTMT